MDITDVSVLTKKILIGFAIILVPLAIIAGGLWFISHFLTK